MLGKSKTTYSPKWWFDGDGDEYHDRIRKKSTTNEIQVKIINSFSGTVDGRNLANHFLGLLHSKIPKNSFETQRMSHPR